MNLDRVDSVYLIGIGGIGMSALARYFKSRNCKVAGYDKTETKLTKELVAEGIKVFYKDDLSSVPEIYQTKKDTALVIYTPAIPEKNTIYTFFIQNDIDLYKRAVVLGKISSNMFTIAVAGTHGKTTTASIIAHILNTADFSCVAFLGGIVSNFNSNVLLGRGNMLVVEADEYDRSFLQLKPDLAVVTFTSPDHLDVYKTEQEFHDAFDDFIDLIPKGGTVVSSNHAELKVKSGLKHIRYSLAEETHVHSYNLRVEDGGYQFDLVSPVKNIFGLQFDLGGRHNVENAVAAIFVAQLLGIEEEVIKIAIASFAGVKRRFEYVVKNPTCIFIDDYAHHPDEIDACLSSVKELFPKKKVTVVFQPHLYSRTRDFADGFGKSLSVADEVLLLDIYPARENPIEGIDSHLIASKIAHGIVKVFSKKEAIAFLKNNPPELILTLGAGDIDSIVEPIKNNLLS
jgi:UDP-N-acetylmuramate--alanine ligase